MNSGISVTKQAIKQNIYTKTEFQNSIARSSFLCRITDIKIAWITAYLSATFLITSVFDASQIPLH